MPVVMAEQLAEELPLLVLGQSQDLGRQVTLQSLKVVSSVRHHTYSARLYTAPTYAYIDVDVGGDLTTPLHSASRITNACNDEASAGPRPRQTSTQS